MNRVRLIILGHVQGVGFRYFCLDQAERLGLRGFARNLKDGSVECEAQGASQAIEDFIALVKQGPRGARVTEVRQEARPTQDGESGFLIG